MSPILLSMLIACPADRLGVELPSGGPDAISMDDLQRDVYALTRPNEDAGAVFARRLGQMQLAAETAEGRVCARGPGGDPARVVVASWTEAVGDAVAAAVLISVAKSWDGQSPPAHATWLCLAREGADLPAGERGPAPPEVEADRIEAIDYRVLKDLAKAYALSLQ